MRTRKLPVVLAAFILFGLGAGVALSESGLMPYLARSLPWPAHALIVLGAVIYGLAFVVALSLVGALATLARRFFLTRPTA